MFEVFFQALFFWHGTMQYMTTLFIDTTSNKEITVRLFIDEHKYLLKETLTFHKAQVVLPMVEKLLKEHQLTLQDLDAIDVHKGPGSFTGVRVGVSVANALGFALSIPVNGKKEIVEPLY